MDWINLFHYYIKKKRLKTKFSFSISERMACKMISLFYPKFVPDETIPILFSTEK